MSSSSTDRRLPRVLAAATLFACAALGAGARATDGAAAAVVGVLPSDDPQVTAEIVRGMRFVLERRPARTRLAVVVGARGERWTTVASEAVRLATRERALVLVSPPDRDRAHLLAQVGTRGRVPIVSTSPAPSVTAAGSKWVVSVVPRAAASARSGAPAAPRLDAANAAGRQFRSAFHRRHGRDPTAWESVGHDAAVVIAEGVRAGGTSRASLMERLRAGRPVRGATGTFAIDAAGNRRRAAGRRGPDGR